MVSSLNVFKTTIQYFSNGKACGPECFGTEFYKAHIDAVSPLLLRMINYSLMDVIFPRLDICWAYVPSFKEGQGCH